MKAIARSKKNPPATRWEKTAQRTVALLKIIYNSLSDQHKELPAGKLTS
jgi:hypothetical protein